MHELIPFVLFAASFAVALFIMVQIGYERYTRRMDEEDRAYMARAIRVSYVHKDEFGTYYEFRQVPVWPEFKPRKFQGLGL